METGVFYIKKDSGGKNETKKVQIPTLSVHLFQCGTYLKTSLHEEMNINNILYSSEWKGPKKGQYLIYTDLYFPVNFHKIRMHASAIKSLKVENAGGASRYSEAMSIHYINARFGAKNFVLENEVEYWIQYKMCDYITIIHGQNIGISVTRAMGFPTPCKFTMKSADLLLYKKMHGLIIARRGISEKHAFAKSILHIWCQTTEIAILLNEAHKRLIDNDNSATLHEILVILTVCEKEYIYKDRMTE